MASGIQFRFELDDVDDITPWGTREERKLHWFGLTSGRYWIDTPLGEVLRYTKAIQTIWPAASPYVDYQIARMFEDLQVCLQSILEPVPEDVANFVADQSWLSRASTFLVETFETKTEESSCNIDLYGDALSWWEDRRIDTLHMKHGPTLFFWRVGDGQLFRWHNRDNNEEGVPVFCLPNGECRVDARDFEVDAVGFCENVLSQMRHRVERIRENGWQRTDCALDVAGLVREQTQREEAFAQVQRNTKSTDWNRVRDRLKRLDQRLRL